MSRKLPFADNQTSRTACARGLLRTTVDEKTGEFLSACVLAERVGWAAALVSGMVADLLGKHWNTPDANVLASGVDAGGQKLPSHAWMALRRLGWTVPAGAKVNDRIVRMAQEQAGRTLRCGKWRADLTAGVLKTWPAEGRHGGCCGCRRTAAGPPFASGRSGDANCCPIHPRIRLESDGRHVTLPRLGTLRTHEPAAELLARVQAGTARILSATVRHERGRWFVCLQAEVKRDLERVARPHVAAGIDLGVKTLSVMADSTGEIRAVPNPGHYDRARKQLRGASRVVARRQGPDRRTGRRPSKRWEKANAALGKVHHRVANLREDALHKLTTSVAAEYGTVVVEDLNVAGMLKNRRLARRIADAGFGQIRRRLDDKTRQRHATRIVVADRW